MSRNNKEESEKIIILVDS